MERRSKTFGWKRWRVESESTGHIAAQKKLNVTTAPPDMTTAPKSILFTGTPEPKRRSKRGDFLGGKASTRSQGYWTH